MVSVTELNRRVRATLENQFEILWVAGELFGFRFAQITDGSVPVYHPDVRVWEVTNAQGGHVGLWYFDPYARPGKNSGAWMNAYRRQSRLDGEVATIVSNNANFVKGKPGESLLLERVKSGEMPPGKKKLSAAERPVLTRSASTRYGIMAHLGQAGWLGHTPITGHQNITADQKKQACSA